jgi:hypothetical protein
VPRHVYDTVAYLKGVAVRDLPHKPRLQRVEAIAQDLTPLPSYPLPISTLLPPSQGLIYFGPATVHHSTSLIHHALHLSSPTHADHGIFSYW